LEEFGFGVDAGAAEGGGEPGVAELGGAVVEVEVEEAGAADELVGGAVMTALNGDPGECGTGSLGLESGVDPGAEVGGGADGEDHVTPDGGVKGNGFKGGEVVEREGFERELVA
jgi:hypothetical protein